MKVTIRGPIFETNSSSEHTFMYLSKEMFEKWRRGEVKIAGGGYPVTNLTDDDFVATEKKPETVYDPQRDEDTENELSWILDAVDNPVVKADLLCAMRKCSFGKEYVSNDFEKWDGSYLYMLLIFLRHGGDCVYRKEANKKYVDPEDWEEKDEDEEDHDYDSVYQSPYIEVMDNGKNVRIHIWGRDNG